MKLAPAEIGEEQGTTKMSATTQSPVVTTALGKAMAETGNGQEGLFQYKDLLLMLIWRDIKIRYKQSVMGFFWAVLMPVLIIGSGMIVMVALSTISGHRINKMDVLAVAAKAVPWAFFVGAVRFGTNSLVANKELVTKIYFPRAIMPIAAVMASFFDFAVAESVLALVLILARVGVSIYLLWFPVLLAVLLVFTAGLALLLACANLFFRDVKYLVEVVITYGIFFTPVFYSAGKLGKWGWILMLNPVGPVLEGISGALVLHQAPSLTWLLYSATWSVLLFFVSWKIFQKSEAAFAEAI
jgi:ABC-type polysaccharide/polyol phosphate export permease